MRPLAKSDEQIVEPNPGLPWIVHVVLWPMVVIGLAGFAAGIASLNPMVVFLGFVVFSLSLNLVLHRSYVAINRSSGLIEARIRQLITWKRNRIKFSELDHFAIEPEYEMLPGRFVSWHLVAIGHGGSRHELLWHFSRAPIVESADTISRLVGRPCREIDRVIGGPRWRGWPRYF